MRTPITYYGGKQSMLNEIIPMIPSHKIYCEPFFGGGAVFFAKQPSYLEVINDTNDRLITFYEVMRDQFSELNDLIQDTLHSEAVHLVARDIYHNRIEASKVQVAWSFWVITNMSFAGSIYGGWKWSNGNAGSHEGVYIRKRRNDFLKLRHRLKDVQISKKDAIEVIQKRDTPKTFFYLDPPYPGADQAHYYGYTMKQFFQLLTVISEIKGQFILSNFPSQTLKWFIIKNGWNYKIVKKLNKVSNLNTPKYKYEMLIWNFDTERNLFNQVENEPLQNSSFIIQNS